MDKVALKGIEEEVFQFNIERFIDNATKSDEEINEKYLKGEVRIVTEQVKGGLHVLHEIGNFFWGSEQI